MDDETIKNRIGELHRDLAKLRMQTGRISRIMAEYMDIDMEHRYEQSSMNKYHSRLALMQAVSTAMIILYLVIK